MAVSKLASCSRCENAVRARGLALHERRCFAPRTVERLLEILGVDTTEPSACWTASAHGLNGQPTSYPRVAGKRFHRWVIILRDGADPSNPHVVGRHTCDHEWCVNPSHIIAGSRTDNWRDAYDRGLIQWQSWKTRALVAEARVAELEAKLCTQVPYCDTVTAMSERLTDC